MLSQVVHRGPSLQRNYYLLEMGVRRLIRIMLLGFRSNILHMTDDRLLGRIFHIPNISGSARLCTNSSQYPCCGIACSGKGVTRRITGELPPSPKSTQPQTSPHHHKGNRQGRDGANVPSQGEQSLVAEVGNQAQAGVERQGSGGGQQQQLRAGQHPHGVVWIEEAAKARQTIPTSHRPLTT